MTGEVVRLRVQNKTLAKSESERQRPWVALLAAGLLWATLSQPLPATDVSCELDRAHERGIVEYLYDGDTIRLGNGRTVRLIGINSPELGRQDEPDEPLAKHARTRLAQLTPPSGTVQLRYDEVRRDRYGRTLAHLFLQDGTNVQEQMLLSGLATVITVPPNLWHLDCYRWAEARAQATGRGLWSLPEYQPVAAEQLTTDRTKGFRLVTGRVRRVTEGRYTIRLYLTERVALQIPRSRLRYFTQYAPKELKGQRVLARGWLMPKRYGLGMTIHHPAALRVFDFSPEVMPIGSLPGADLYRPIRALFDLSARHAQNQP
ncbi:MAG: thermonuclease family protein [Gammaproteobacteria bacterium]